MLPSPRLCSGLMENDWLARPSGLTCLCTFFTCLMNEVSTISITRYQIIQRGHQTSSICLPGWEYIYQYEPTFISQWQQGREWQWIKSEEEECLKQLSAVVDGEEKQLMIWTPITCAETLLPLEMMLTQAPVPSRLLPQDSDPTWLFKVLFLILLPLLKWLCSQFSYVVSSRINFILWRKRVIASAASGSFWQHHKSIANIQELSFVLWLPTSELQSPTGYSEVD